MPKNIACVELHANEWARLRDIRLKALIDCPHAFGGTYENESVFDEERWRLEFAKQAFVVASVDGIDSAMMYVENLKGDFNATCWVGGCWSDPDFRGVGLMRVMFEFLDKQATARDWSVQGLGVCTDNELAISAYEKIGFVEVGGPQPSTRQPGKFYQRMIRKTMTA